MKRSLKDMMIGPNLQSSQTPLFITNDSAEKFDYVFMPEPSSSIAVTSTKPLMTAPLASSLSKQAKKSKRSKNGISSVMAKTAASNLPPNALSSSSYTVQIADAASIKHSTDESLYALQKPVTLNQPSLISQPQMLKVHLNADI